MNIPHLSRFAIVAAGLLAGAALAPAANAAPDTPRPAGTEAAGIASAPSASPKQRYCIVESAVTGSILSRKTCKTRSQWLAQGFDPLAPAAK